MMVEEYKDHSYTALFSALVERYGPPPPQFFLFDSAITAFKDGMETVNVGFINGKCLEKVIQIPVEDWKAILRKAFPQA